MEKEVKTNNIETKKCIKDTEAYDVAFLETNNNYLEQSEKKALGGQAGYQKGVKVNSPWGDNTVLEASTDENGIDTVIKEITVKSGFMLSLQRHRGREEFWEVESGTLTVILDGKLLTVNDGKSLLLPKGSVHCMINMHDEPVTVRETQTGICREADNVRLIDFNNRQTYPLKTKNEAQSAILYSTIHSEILEKFDCESKPNMVLLSSEFKQFIEEMR